MGIPENLAHQGSSCDFNRNGSNCSRRHEDNKTEIGDNAKRRNASDEMGSEEEEKNLVEILSKHDGSAGLLSQMTDAVS